MSDERDDRWREALERGLAHVPLALYDEHRKPAETAFAEILAALETAERRLRHSELHRTMNRRSMRRRGRTIDALEGKIVRLRAALRETQGRKRLGEHERAAELHHSLRNS